jgi:Flp pilus assembly pilin Flp
MMEYVLIAVVVGATILFVLARFSGSIGGRWNEASKRVDSTTSTRRGSPDADTGAAQGTSAGGGGQGSSGQGPSAAPAGQPEEEPTPGLPASKGKVRVGNLEIDFSTIIWLAVLIIVAAVLIIVQIFAAARRKPKPQL